MSDFELDRRVGRRFPQLLDPLKDIGHVVVGQYAGALLELQMLMPIIGIDLYKRLKGAIIGMLTNYESEFRFIADGNPQFQIQRSSAYLYEILSSSAKIYTVFGNDDGVRHAAARIEDEVYRRAEGASRGVRSWVERSGSGSSDSLFPMRAASASRGRRPSSLGGPQASAHARP